jgi:sugar O-acyltransferase (sialic acid O-acetyltransferase NeuD family)
MSDKILLVGGFIEIIELCEENNIEIVGLVDNKKLNENSSLPIIGGEKNINDWKENFLKTKIVVTPDLPNIRKKLVLFYSNHGFGYSTIISNLARVSKSAIIHCGSVIQAGVNISSEVTIGEFVKINNNANVMHNVIIGNFTTIAPNAVILGHVKIGECCYIGANATILPHVSICDNVTIGAGAVVTKSIETPFFTYAGVPARKLLKDQMS